MAADTYYASANSVIGGHDLKCAMAAVLGFRPSRAFVGDVLGHTRMSATREEFKAAMSRYEAMQDPRDSMKTLFRLFDRGDRGFVTFEDIEAVALEVCPSLPRATIIDSFLEADTTGSGRCTFPQFEALMSRLG